MQDGDFVRDLYDAAYPRLVGQLIAVTGSREEAEDVVQEAFARGVLIELDAEGHTTKIPLTR
jgi:DNA-directed RNA polymerase specialized sigma24 family protein